MRYLSISIDNRAITCDEEGHSARWHRRLGKRVEQVDVLVECRRQHAREPKALAENVRFFPVCPPTAHLYPLYALRVALAAHRQKPYDIVTSEDPFRPGMAAAMFQRLTGVPFCAEYHTECFFNHEWLARRPVIHRVYDWLGRRVVRQATAVRCVNQKHAAQIRSICHDQPDKLIEVCPVPSPFYDPALYGPDAQALRREFLGDRANDGGLIALYVGRVEPIKNVDRLVRLHARLRKEHPGTVLVVVGNGSELEACRALVESLGDHDARFAGYVPESKVYGYYGAADFLVNAADVEPFARVYGEAMSVGLPLVTTRDSGTVQDGLTVDGETCLVFEPGDEEGLYRAMERLVLDTALRQRVGEAARARARERLDYDVLLQRMIDFFQKVAERGQAAKRR